ncbi:MAG: IS256 family transposase, partial [Gemmatimonadota bacterium]
MTQPKMGEPAGPSRAAWETLEDFAGLQVQAFIQRLLEEEVTELLGRGKSARREAGSAAGYRNGYGQPRRLALTSGTIPVRRPRVRGLSERFESRLLPLFKRRTEALGSLLPELYLHGLAEGDFELALRGLLGDGAPLSASSMARLKASWQVEYATWRTRSRAGLEVVYLWADGLYVKAGVGDGKAALLVVIGALSDGRKVVLAVESGQRESTASWAAVLRDLKARGLAAPRLTIADGHLGIWGALAEIYPASAEQRCWNHKMTNVLDQVPRREQAKVKAWLRKMMYAETRAVCEAARKRFAAEYRRPYPKAVETLERDWERLVSFFAFPEPHWLHLRTTNIVESPFAAVRLRTTAGKRYKKVANATALIWKVLCVAEKTFR